MTDPVLWLRLLESGFSRASSAQIRTSVCGMSLLICPRNCYSRLPYSLPCCFWICLFNVAIRFSLALCCASYFTASLSRSRFCSWRTLILKNCIPHDAAALPHCSALSFLLIGPPMRQCTRPRSLCRLSQRTALCSRPCRCRPLGSTPEIATTQRSPLY